VDLNGDGKLDLVVSNFSSSSLSIFLNTTPIGGGTPSFITQAQEPMPPGSFPHSVVGSDVNLDGKVDLLVATYGTGNATILINTTPSNALTATFLPPLPVPVGNGTRSIAVADFDLDGWPDIASANYIGNNISVSMNTTAPGSSTATFSGPASFVSGTAPTAIRSADVNLDGKADLIVTALGDGGQSQLRVLRNTTAPGGSPAFTTAATPTVGSQPVTAVVADFNLDGRPDIATSNDGAGSTTVLLNTTAPGSPNISLASPTTIDIAGNAPWIEAEDLNLDGRPDLLLTDFPNSVLLLPNTTPPGGAVASFGSAMAMLPASGPGSIAVADFNKDGRVDVATANRNNETISVRLNTPLGAVQFESESSSAPENAAAGIRLVRDGGTVAGPVQVTASVTGGTASPTDATGLPAAVSFSQGDISPKDVPLSVQNDGILEPPETVVLGIGNPSVGLGLGARTSHTHTITDALCSPRPAPTVSVNPLSANALRATVSAGVGSLSAVQLGDPAQNPPTPTNVSVDIQGGPEGISTAFTYNPPPGTNQVILTLNRVSSESGVTLPLVLMDACGSWRTFAGGGPAAFGGAGAGQAANAASSRRPDMNLSPRQSCGSFPSQAAAQAFLRDNPTDPRNMDRSRDGIACESADGAGSISGPFDRRPVARR
jgi:hypothetical protein